MQIRFRTALPSLFLLMLGGMVFPTVSADTVEVRFYDESGTPLNGDRVGVYSADRVLLQKAELGAEGSYPIELQPAQKVMFQIHHPVSGELIRHQERLPAELPPSLDITVGLPQAAGRGDPPPNDLCEDAVALTPDATIAGTTIDSTLDPEVYFDGTPVTGPGVWYKVIGTGNTITASTCDAADFDTVMHVICNGCEETDLVVFAARDDTAGCDNFTTELSWCGAQGVEYRILISGFMGSTGDFVLTMSDSGQACDDPWNFVCGEPEFLGACCLETCLDPRQSECFVTTEYQCLDMDGEYQGDGTSCFVEGDLVVYSDSPGVTIPDNDPAGIVVPMEVPVEESCLIGDVNVEFQITHTWRDDLSIEVFHPDGPTSMLWDRSCNGRANLYVTADDDYFGPHQCALWGVGPSDEIFFNPVGEGNGTPISVFDGLESGGTWSLRMQDHAVADEGTLDFWALHITCARPTCELADRDGDGIGDDIDGEYTGGGFIDRSSDPWNESFTDQHLGGATYGSILDRGGLDLTVENQPEPSGVRMRATGGCDPAVVDVCGIVEARLTHRDEVVITCGSVTVQVIDGPVEFLLAGGVLVMVPDEATVTLTELAGGQVEIENQSPEGTMPVVVSIDGEENAVGPGESWAVTVGDDEDEDEEADRPPSGALEAPGRTGAGDDGLLELDTTATPRDQTRTRPDGSSDRVRSAKGIRNPENRRDSEGPRLAD